MNTISIYLTVAIALGIIIGYARYSVTKNRVSKQPDRPFPHQWRDLLNQYVVFYQRLNSHDQTKFEHRIHVFLLNVQIIGVETEVSHLDRILIASGAIIPIFGFEKWHYSSLHCVEVHPDKFLIPGTDQYANGLVGWGKMNGKVKLSRKALVEGFYNNNNQQNVAIHEFVHVLDMQDGAVDGRMATIIKEIDIMPWLQLIRVNMERVNAGNSTIRKYATTSNGEFLAVVSEFFFENPDKMKTEHPELYRSLDNIYNPKKVAPNLFSYRKSERDAYAR